MAAGVILTNICKNPQQTNPRREISLGRRMFFMYVKNINFVLQENEA